MKYVTSDDVRTGLSIGENETGELEVAEMIVIRVSLGVTRKDRIRNEHNSGILDVARQDKNFIRQKHI